MLPGRSGGQELEVVISVGNFGVNFATIHESPSCDRYCVHRLKPPKGLPCGAADPHCDNWADGERFTPGLSARVWI